MLKGKISFDFFIFFLFIFCIKFSPLVVCCNKLYPHLVLCFLFFLLFLIFFFLFSFSLPSCLWPIHFLSFSLSTSHLFFTIFVCILLPSHCFYIFICCCYFHSFNLYFINFPLYLLLFASFCCYFYYYYYYYLYFFSNFFSTSYYCNNNNTIMASITTFVLFLYGYFYKIWQNYKMKATLSVTNIYLFILF